MSSRDCRKIPGPSESSGSVPFTGHQQPQVPPDLEWMLPFREEPIQKAPADSKRQQAQKAYHTQQTRKDQQAQQNYTGQQRPPGQLPRIIHGNQHNRPSSISQTMGHQKQRTQVRHQQTNQLKRGHAALKGSRQELMNKRARFFQEKQEQSAKTLRPADNIPWHMQKGCQLRVARERMKNRRAEKERQKRQDRSNRDLPVPASPTESEIRAREAARQTLSAALQKRTKRGVLEQVIGSGGLHAWMEKTIANDDAKIVPTNYDWTWRQKQFRPEECMSDRIDRMVGRMVGGDHEELQEYLRLDREAYIARRTRNLRRVNRYTDSDGGNSGLFANKAMARSTSLVRFESKSAVAGDKRDGLAKEARFTSTDSVKRNSDEVAPRNRRYNLRPKKRASTWKDCRDLAEDIAPFLNKEDDPAGLLGGLSGWLAENVNADNLAEHVKRQSVRNKDAESCCDGYSPFDTDISAGAESDATSEAHLSTISGTDHPTEKLGGTDDKNLDDLFAVEWLNKVLRESTNDVFSNAATRFDSQHPPTIEELLHLRNKVTEEIQQDWAVRLLLEDANVSDEPIHLDLEPFKRALGDSFVPKLMAAVGKMITNDVAYAKMARARPALTGSRVTGNRQASGSDAVTPLVDGPPASGPSRGLARSPREKLDCNPKHKESFRPGIDRPGPLELDSDSDQSMEEDTHNIEYASDEDMLDTEIVCEAGREAVHEEEGNNHGNETQDLREGRNKRTQKKTKQRSRAEHELPDTLNLQSDSDEQSSEQVQAAIRNLAKTFVTEDSGTGSINRPALRSVVRECFENKNADRLLINAVNEAIKLIPERGPHAVFQTNSVGDSVSHTSDGCSGNRTVSDSHYSSEYDGKRRCSDTVACESGERKMAQGHEPQPPHPRLSNLRFWSHPQPSQDQDFIAEVNDILSKDTYNIERDADKNARNHDWARAQIRDLGHVPLPELMDFDHRECIDYRLHTYDYLQECLEKPETHWPLSVDPRGTYILSMYRPQDYDGEAGEYSRVEVDLEGRKDAYDGVEIPISSGTSGNDDNIRDLNNFGVGDAPPRTSGLRRTKGSGSGIEQEDSDAHRQTARKRPIPLDLGNDGGINDEQAETYERSQDARRQHAEPNKLRECLQGPPPSQIRIDEPMDYGYGRHLNPNRILPIPIAVNPKPSTQYSSYALHYSKDSVEDGKKSEIRAREPTTSSVNPSVKPTTAHSPILISDESTDEDWDEEEEEELRPRGPLPRSIPPVTKKLLTPPNDSHSIGPTTSPTISLVPSKNTGQAAQIKNWINQFVTPPGKETSADPSDVEIDLTDPISGDSYAEEEEEEEEDGTGTENENSQSTNTIKSAVPPTGSGRRLPDSAIANARRAMRSIDSSRRRASHLELFKEDGVMKIRKSSGPPKFA